MFMNVKYTSVLIFKNCMKHDLDVTIWTNWKKKEREKN